MLISVKKQKFTYQLHEELFTVFKVISDQDFLNNSYILDKESRLNDFKCPDKSKIESTLIEDFNNGDYTKIKRYIYESGVEPPTNLNKCKTAYWRISYIRC